VDSHIGRKLKFFAFYFGLAIYSQKAYGKNKIKGYNQVLFEIFNSHNRTKI
jgi:hypothetical protein